MKKRKARTTVDVYRLFKVRDFGVMLAAADDGLVRWIGKAIAREADAMLGRSSGRGIVSDDILPVEEDLFY